MNEPRPLHDRDLRLLAGSIGASALAGLVGLALLPHPGREGGGQPLGVAQES